MLITAIQLAITMQCRVWRLSTLPEGLCRGGVFGLSRRRLLNLCTVKCSLASSRERVATCPESAVKLWVVRTSGRKRESVGQDHFIARRIRHRLGSLRGLANMIPYTVCSSSSPSQDKQRATTRQLRFRATKARWTWEAVEKHERACCAHA